MAADTENGSEHQEEEVGNGPEGWEGGQLLHTGGNIHAREWVHPEKGLRVGYSIDDPSVVGVEKVRRVADGERTNPQVWQHVEDIESEPCDGEDGCLETALNLMQRLSEEE